MKIARIYLRVSAEQQDLTRQADIEHSTRMTGYYIAGQFDTSDLCRMKVPSPMKLIAFSRLVTLTVAAFVLPGASAHSQAPPSRGTLRSFDFQTRRWPKLPKASAPVTVSALPSIIGPGAVQWQKLPPHPRLFANAAHFDAVKKRNDEVSQQLLALLRYDAAQKLAASPIIYPQGSKFGAVREVQGRILTLSLMYRLTGEKRYFERARQELLQLAALPDWGPGHFLDVGEASLAAGVGLDWLYDDLTPGERDQIAQSIVKNALLPSLEQKEGGGSWVDGDFNWTQVCHGGLTVGALAVAEREPELARKIVGRAVANMPKVTAIYAPDGAFPEAPNYWSYGTTFEVMLIEALRSALDTSGDIEKAPGFLKTADFLTQIIAPTGTEWNYSDSGRLEQSEPVLLWFARENRKRQSARLEFANIARANAALTAMQAGKGDKIPRLSRHLAMGLLWWNPKLPPMSATSSLPLHWTAGGSLPLAILRSAWDDRRATFVTLKGGTPNHSHAHMDVGSFILEADGVRWAVDLGAESYGKMRAAKLDLWNYSQNSTRWTTFRVGPEAHNIMRFDGGQQNSDGRATVEALPPQNGAQGNVTDLTPIYRGQIDHVERRVTLYPDRSVSLEDRWKTGDKPVEAAWQWLTFAKVTRTPRGVLLQQAGESLELKFELPTGATIAIEDVSQAKNPQDSPNPGLQRIVITMPTAAQTRAALTVQAIPGSVSNQLKPKY